MFLSFAKKQVINYMLWLGISKYMTKDKLRMIMNAFFSSQFACCPLIWVLHNRTLGNRINKLQERALR